MDAPNVDDSPDASPEEIRRAQLVERGLFFAIAALFAARFFLPRVLPLAYVVTGLVVPFAAIALVALRGNFFTYAVDRDKPTRGHASVAPLLLVPALILLYDGLNRYAPNNLSQVIHFALAGGLLMTLIAVATSSGLWRRWILSGMIFIMTSLYAAGAAMVVNGMFDHADANADMLVIEFTGSTYIRGSKTGSYLYHFMVNYLDNPRYPTYIIVSRELYETKQKGDVICIMHSPGYLRMPRSWITECRDSDFSVRRKALQQYGADYAMQLFKFNKLGDAPLRNLIEGRTASDLEAVTGKEFRAQIEGRVQAIYRAAEFAVGHPMPTTDTSTLPPTVTKMQKSGAIVPPIESPANIETKARKESIAKRREPIEREQEAKSKMEAPQSKCVIKPVMTDEDLANCRN